MSTLKESRLPTISGFTALEEVVQEVRQKRVQEATLENNPSNNEATESDMLHCVTPDPQQPAPFWKGAFRRQLQGKLSKNERHRKEIKQK